MSYAAKSRRGLELSLLAWLAVSVVWFFVTRGFHPTLGLAAITTASLMLAYSCTTYFHHLVLVPRYLRAGRVGTFWIALLSSMAIMTGLALAIIRNAYLRTLGPDPDPNGVWIHYAIDFIGMAVHVLAAAVVVSFYRRHVR